ncbi:fibronectin type III domain-containing protein [Microbulbifer magnicolonia]|uniref:fibronectin type III domain-containing protein n=1 Tax=Microbulbifer magnicolonia TaxID=3109744 RepID=UPI002B412F65|nr:fibronectin type III domain-containing protein [Microbulbifer sp. GG15]
MKAWHSTAASLFLLSCLTACGGGGADSDNEGDVVNTPPASSASDGGSSSGGSSSGGSSGGGSSSGGSSGGASEGPILSESFGDDQFANMDRNDNITLFSPDYKAVAAVNGDEWPSFYYPTCCFFDDASVAGDGYIDDLADRLGLKNDSGNPALLIHNARFAIGQTKPDNSASDPKINSTTSDDLTTWGELDLSQSYRVSFCVKEADGSGLMQIYVDNNSTGEANSFHGGGSRGSRIFNVNANLLVPGQRVEVNIPGNTLVAGEVLDSRPELVGTATSFLQFRADSSATVMIDDLLIEAQSENGQAALPACNVFAPASPPATPEAPSVSGGDASIRVTWNGIVGALQYDLAYGNENDVTKATPLEDVSSPHTLEGLTNDTPYFVFLRVRNAAGWSDWSEAGTATPEAPPAPVGDSCAPTTQVDTAIPWSVYDGCLSPSENGSVVYDTSVQGTFDFGSSDPTLFTAVTSAENEKLGTALLDTTADAAYKSRGEIADIFAAGYPKHFTAIARIKAADPAQRGFEMQTYFAEASKRVNMMLRPDQGEELGRIHLEKFTDGTEDVKAEAPLQDGDFHIYHIAFTMTDADTLTAKVYIDGNDAPVIDVTSTGRDAGGENKFRVGEDSSSAHLAEVDWIVWTTDAATAAKAPSELVDQLPDTIGELGAYAAGAEAWTGAALDLGGESGTAPSGSVLLNEADKVTIAAAGGSVSSDSVRKFFAYREVSGNFTFTARLKSVTTTDGSPFVTSSNSYRFGVAVMESVTPAASFQEVGRFATIDYWVSETATPAFDGSRAHKLDVGDTAESKRSRSSAALAIGDYLRIQIVDEAGTPRVIRSAAPADFPNDFTQLNSSAFKDEGSVGFPSSWFVGVYGAPGDDLTLEFDEITITQD